MIDNGIVGMSWITLKAGDYKIRKKQISNSQLEIEVSFSKVISHPPEGKYSKIAPIRILSMDIECAAKNGRFPKADLDPIIQIANYCTEFGSKEPVVCKLFSLKECAPIAGVDISSFQKEDEMLEKFNKFLMEFDPDIITGYNINNFDLPYLLNRAEKLKVDDFRKLSKIKSTITKIKHNKGKSKSTKNRDFIDMNIEGRIILDMYIYIMKEHNLRSYTLNNVSFTLLGEQKEDVHHTMIYDLWEKDEFTRRRLGIYCMKDAYLPWKLSEKLMTIYNFAEMCRVTCTPLNFILTRGQQIKVSSQLHRKALEFNYIIPCKKIKINGDDEEGYEGAYVLEPQKGFYEIPIVTLDFASLYPSIMMAHNLCYSTLLKPGEEKTMDKKDYYMTPTKDCFVKAHVRKGILPIILEELIDARKKAKVNNFKKLKF
jgi:DNA polymerase delta subunit 1